MSLPPGFLEELRARISVTQVVGRKVSWDLKKSNQTKGDMWAPCPFHQEKTASFHVDDQKGFYYCFGCHAKGDAISFVKETENVNFIEAVEILAKEAGLQIPEQDPQAKEKSSYRDELFKIMDLSVRFYQRSLSSAKGVRAREYINSRKLTSEITGDFELGFAPNSRTELFDYLSDKNIPEQQIIDTGMCLRPDDGGAAYDRFRDRIMYPIRDSRGRCIAFGGRAMSQNARAKYLNSPETKLFDKGRSLYNLSAARSALNTQSSLIVAEGYMDVIALSQENFKASVAPLGTAITKEQLALIWRISPSPVVALDGDRAGVNAAYRLIDLALPLIETGKTIKFALMPEGYDPDSYVKTNREGFDNLINNSIPLSQYIINYLKSDIDITTVEGKTSFALEAKKVLSQMPDIMYTDILREKIQEMTGNVIPKKNQTSNQKKKIVSSNVNEEFDIKELTLLSLFIEYPKLLKEFDCKDVITENALINIYNAIEEEISHNENFTAAHLLKLFPDDTTIKSIVSFESNEKSEDSARVTIKEIFHQLELSSKEKIYFDLLNRYTEGQKLSDDERKFIKNFKK